MIYILIMVYSRFKLTLLINKEDNSYTSVVNHDSITVNEPFKWKDIGFRFAFSLQNNDFTIEDIDTEGYIEWEVVLKTLSFAQYPPSVTFEPIPFHKCN